MNIKHIDISDLDGISVNMHEETSFDIILNEQIEVHISKNYDGISVDLYKYRNQDEMDDDYNFDDDLITSCYAFEGDYLDDENEE